MVASALGGNAGVLAARQCRAVEGAAQFHRSRSKDKTRRRCERKTVAAAAEMVSRQSLAIAVGEHLPDLLPAGINVEANRPLGMVDILGAPKLAGSESDLKKLGQE
jgi:hypothetical protein